MKPIKITEYKGEFFKILTTSDKSQVGIMTIKPGKSSGAEGAHNADQIIYIIEGECEVKVNSEKVKVKKGEVATIPADTNHQLFNTGKGDLFFLTIYAPPEY